MTRRVVVTGVGAVTPLGIGAETFWRELLAGHSGIRSITGFDASDLEVKIAGEVPGGSTERAAEFLASLSGLYERAARSASSLS